MPVCQRHEGRAEDERHAIFRQVSCPRTFRTWRWSSTFGHFMHCGALRYNMQDCGLIICVSSAISLLERFHIDAALIHVEVEIDCGALALKQEFVAFTRRQTAVSLFNRCLPNDMAQQAHGHANREWSHRVHAIRSQCGALDMAGLNRYTLPGIGMELLNASLGATAVLLFAVPESKLSQPRNVVGEPSSLCTLCTPNSPYKNSCDTRTLWPEAAPVFLKLHHKN